MSPNRDMAYLVSGVCCSTEENVLRKALDRSLGGSRYVFSPVTCELKVSAEVAPKVVLNELHRAGFGGRQRGEMPSRKPFFSRHAEGISTLSAAVAGIVGIILGGIPGRVFLGVAMAIGGWRIPMRGFGAIRSGALDMNVLMSVAVIGAIAIGKWEEAAAVVVLFAVSLMLESYSNARSRRALGTVLSLSPASVTVVRNGRESTVATADVALGEVILIRPGDRVPLDGVVTHGESAVNEAPVTGESSPVTKREGASIYAGSLNGVGALHVRTTRVAGDSTIARISTLVERALERRAPVQRTVDRFARIYTPGVLALAVGVAILPPLAWGAPFEPWLYRALVLLVTACPCALVISTPVALVSAMSRAARTGMLIKGGTHIETLSRVSTLAFDKTGTMTTGQIALTDILPLSALGREELLSIVAALERNSEHHLAGAVIRLAEDSAVNYAAVPVEEFEAVPGMGVRGRIAGKSYILGNRLLSEEEGVLSPEVEGVLRRFESEGKTAVVLGADKLPLCVLAFRDGVRHHGRSAVEKLRKDGVRRLVMLSGDHEVASEAVAGELGIDELHAGILPAQKAEIINRLRRSSGYVGMVGDGINDAPALAAASVGIAMGVAGSDAALETADVVLMSDNIAHLPFLFRLSKKTMTIIHQNIAFATAIKTAVLLLALAGTATLWMAILADDGAAILVVLNALRILTSKDEP
ncbi:MAG TPA: heavy metal translocating P-type ATPase [Bacteroidota bacterium]|nr:heavy metal translocating P-type ATPase [Bacteroidota bacterium]